jgi:hypothetical protein
LKKKMPTGKPYILTCPLWVTSTYGFGFPLL